MKLGQKAKNIETRLDKLEEVERPEFSVGYRFSLGGSVHNSKLLVEVENVSKSYEDNTILKDNNFEIRGNSHIHLKGLNGSGKSTLLRLIATT